jgi:hypothetical protein
MKIQIVYELLRHCDSQFWANSKVHGAEIWTCGRSWEEVRILHVEKLRKLAAPSAPRPAPEEIEL